ncbi:hypothetical protein [Sulfitobacter sabulilitoris]|uniref:hypothetical protein n=1 Tax=Sulfitobacter sabulilitoris TaxID=2562655 RepID=UPI001478E118|nr:hypothetical protein [Sulfitobacter sabulilitoris]
MPAEEAAFSGDDPFAMPGPRADHRRLTDPAAWRKAEASHAADLARAAGALSALDQACRHVPGSGAGERLALIEIEAMLWAAGARIPRERIGQHLRAAGGVSGDPAALAEARWAMRRLSDRPGPLPDLRGFLGLHRVDVPALADTLLLRPVGAEFDLAAEAFGEGMAELADSHPITRAAYCFALWPVAGLSHAEALVEPAVAAARIAGSENRSLGFAPLAPGRDVWRQGASIADRLSRWIAATRSGAQTAMLELDRITVWAAAARAATSGINGTSPSKLIEALTARPILTTQDAACLAGISRASAERMLGRMQSMNVVREITGQGRFRLWTAR